MHTQIPGHVRAHTWIPMLAGGWMAWHMTHNLFVIACVEMIVVGMFLGDHVTHLRQHHENDTSAPPTTLERTMLRYPGFYRWFGVSLFTLGLLLLLILSNVQYLSGYREGYRYGASKWYEKGYIEGAGGVPEIRVPE
jgi:hypothetical protein